ncbi:dihydrodipicolinate synthase family protein [Anaerococcus vaginalis]|uniref:dihydrodipicolinate synthase family protein n=1 Tax=Anaerococcus vaginalis TaxID=33037 RepID=UPI00290432C9|nr:dihydrodipicolinate synthase family protein [Anaerococcus vaginalis]MDU2375236.1 dihydrodipicolinate synthase family protein [Anaerococcus vaginalis]
MCEIIVPVVTVFDENEKPDFEENKKVIDFLVEGGVDGILVLGSTGEFTVLDYEDKLRFAKEYYDYTNGRVDLYLGSNCPSFEDTVKLSNEAIKIGYKGVMVIGPYYFGTDDEKMFIYYNELAKKVDGDIYIYNFPARSGYSISGNTYAKLVNENNNIVGLKDSVMDPLHTNRLLRSTEGKNTKVYSGFDDQYLYNLTTGGSGCIGALANLVPDLWADLIKATKEKKFEKVYELSTLIHKLMPLYDLDSNFSHLFKRLMGIRGVDISSKSIFPYNQLSEDIYEKGRKILEDVVQEYEQIK